jgi:hypothetical protein
MKDKFGRIQKETVISHFTVIIPKCMEGLRNTENNCQDGEALGRETNS